MTKKILNFIKQKWTRIFITSITLVGVLLTTILGSVFYTSQNGKAGIDYGGGAQITVQIRNEAGEVADKQLTSEVFDNIIKRVDPLGINNVAQSSFIGKDGYITIAKGDVKTNKTMKHFEELITTKPVLSIYTTSDKSLFENGVGQQKHGGVKPGVHQTDERFRAPFAKGAKPIFQNGEWVVQIQLKNQHAQNEWGKVTKWFSTQKDKRAVIWLDHQRLFNEMLNKPALAPFLAASRFNLFQAIHIPPTTKKPKAPAYWNKLFVNEGLLPATQYMISVAEVKTPLYQKTFVISGHFDSDSAKDLASRINYGASEYSIELKSSHFLTAEYGASAFNKAITAGIIVFSLIAIFMVVNYGLLGALSTISIALYMFLTLTMFTVMRGEYSPETIAALIIGIGMSVDASIITFERLKKEIWSGASPTKAHMLANKLSLSTIFDANITTLIVGFVLFYFGTTSIKGFSIMLILSIIFTLFVMLLFTRFISTLLVKIGVFNNRLWLLGINKNNIGKEHSIKVQNLINYNYMKNSKWFVLGSSIFITIAIIVFAATAGVAGKLSGGFNSSIEFAGGSIVDISSKSNKMNILEANKVIDKLVADGQITKDEAHLIYKNADKSNIGIEIKSINSIPQNKIEDSLKSLLGDYNVMGQSVTSEVAKELVKDAMIAITLAMLAIVLYTLIRFKWTFSIAAILALVHDGLIVTAVFVITRVQLSPIFIAGILSVIGYSINDTIVTFDRVREKLREQPGNLDKTKLLKIANNAIKDTIKRSILTTATTLGAVVILMMFGNATKMSFNIAMLAGLISGTYSSIFIATYSWVILEAFSRKKSAKRAETQFWKLDEQEEQTIQNINDFID